jgi:hypothetical protein
VAPHPLLALPPGGSVFTCRVNGAMTLPISAQCDKLSKTWSASHHRDPEELQEVQDFRAFRYFKKLGTRSYVSKKGCDIQFYFKTLILCIPRREYFGTIGICNNRVL